MTAFAYLGALLVSIGCLALIDKRWSVAFWQDAGRTAKTLAAGIGLFIVWDVIGIGLGVFFHGNSRFALPYRLAPEFPIEEIFFLFLLCYTTLILYVFGSRRWPRT